MEVAEQCEAYLVEQSSESGPQDRDLIGSKAHNSAQLLALSQSSEGLFSAPRQVSIPNFVFQAIMAEIKMNYLEQLEQFKNKYMDDEQVEQVRQYTIQLVED